MQHLIGTLPVGIDVASKAVEQAREAGHDAYHCALENAPAHIANLPLITAVDLIEHVVHPDEFLAEAPGRLCPGGVLSALRATIVT